MRPSQLRSGEDSGFHRHEIPTLWYLQPLLESDFVLCCQVPNSLFHGGHAFVHPLREVVFSIFSRYRVTLPDYIRHKVKVLSILQLYSQHAKTLGTVPLFQRAKIGDREAEGRFRVTWIMELDRCVADNQLAPRFD